MDILPATPEQAANFVWIASLSLGLVVSLVVALLLWLIHHNVRVIDGRVSRIWDVGQQIANNTIHIPTLYRINDGVDQILATALRINDGAALIESHANGCPGCPHCMQQH